MADNRAIPILLSIIAIFVLGVILLELRAVLLPFSVALLLSFIFQPVVVYLKSKRIPMVVNLTIVVVLLAIVLFLVGLLVFSSAKSFTEEFSQYEERINTLAHEVTARIDIIASSLNLDMADLDIDSLLNVSAITSVVSASLGTFLNALSNTLLVILFMLFILAGSGQLSTKITRAFEPEVAKRILGAIEDISQQARQYLVAKTVVSLLTGVLIFLVLWILGVDFPVFWGFLAFIFNFVPNIGSLAAVVLPFCVSLLQFETLLIPIVALLLMLVVETVIGNMIDPRMMAFSLNLSPLLVIVCLIFWGWLWGIVGMILAVPLTATIKIFLDNLERTRPVAVLMGGVPKPRPIKPPAEEEQLAADTVD